MVCRETEASIAARLQAQRYETSNGIKQPNCRSSVAIKNGWSYTAASLTSSCCGLGQLYFWIEVNGKLHSPFALSPVKEALFISWTGGRVQPRTGLCIPATGNKPRFSIPWLVTTLAEHYFSINKALFICIYLFNPL